MSNEETHDTVISPMAPSYCRNCGLSGAELRWNPCPKQLQSNITDNRFNRFDDELIDKYFNDDGKKAIKEYVAKELTAYKKELLSKAVDAVIDFDPGPSGVVKAIPVSAIEEDEVENG